MSSERELDLLVESLLSDPQHFGHPLREALARLQQQNLDQLSRLERIARISDGYQSLAREQNLDFAALSIDEKDELWNTAKAEEQAAKA